MCLILLICTSLKIQLEVVLATQHDRYMLRTGRCRLQGELKSFAAPFAQEA